MPEISSIKLLNNVIYTVKDTTARAAAASVLTDAKQYTDEITTAIETGQTFKGSVSSIGDLPLTASIGDSYIVEYGTTSPFLLTNSMFLYTGAEWKKISTTTVYVDDNDDGNIQVQIY